MVRFRGSFAGLGLALLLGSCAPTAAPDASENVEPPVADETPSVSKVAEAPASPPAPEPAVALNTSPSADNVLFTCLTADDKQIELYDMGSSIQYIFGPSGQPELALDVPRDQVSTYQWQGIGRYENYSASVPNDNVGYSILWSRDRLDIDQPPAAGVDVEIDGEYVTTVDCATDATHNLIGVDLPPAR